MDDFAQEVRSRMPLAEAVLLLWRHAADADELERVFEDRRGRSYTEDLSFPQMVQLVGDCLLQHGGHGNRAFSAAREKEELKTSVRAVYGKLARIPVEVSMAFLAHGSDRLRALCPAESGRCLPKSLRRFTVDILDGKTVKNVQKRFKVLRGKGGGVLGGKALVALSLNTGLVFAMHAHPDGDANEVRFVGELLPELDERAPKGPRLTLWDGGFCDLIQMERHQQQDRRFLVRHHPKLSFHRDEDVKAAQGKDGEGRTYHEEWGWAGVPSDRRRCYVRRITLERTDDKPVILLTDLLDAKKYPAGDILELYRMRWGIEQVFQQVTEVFGLEKLIGTSPQATIFQLAFCLLIYNMIQIVKGRIAAAQEQPVETISTVKLFDDVKKHLSSWQLFFSNEDTIAYLATFTTAGQTQRRLRRLLDPLWSNVWIKSPKQKRGPTPRGSGPSRMHTSLFRMLALDQERQGPRRRKKPA